jgi:hypothetical protein
MRKRRYWSDGWEGGGVDGRDGWEGCEGRVIGSGVLGNSGVCLCGVGGRSRRNRRNRPPSDQADDGQRNHKKQATTKEVHQLLGS